MTRTQFRLLYREFLFCIVDLELLSAQADIGKLLGQLGGILGVISLILSLGAFFVDSRGIPRGEFLVGAWGIEHFLISTTMLVVGLFAVLSWESTFPTKRDLLILAPLPVSTRTLFLAKLAATSTGLAIAVVATNLFTGLSWPMALAGGDSFLVSAVRTFAAYWVTMFAAGAFVYCCALLVQGVAAQLLPHWFFLRISAFLQIAAFTLLLSVYFLEPHWTTPTALGAHHAGLRWLPSFWFLGLFQLLNGSMHPVLKPLAKWAFVGLAGVMSGAALAFALSYVRTVRRIVEEPDIAPNAAGLRWIGLPGRSLQTTIAQFAIRTVLRSRQHRAILSFYLGVGLAITVFYMRTNLGQQAAGEASLRQVSVPFLLSTVVMMFMAVLGIRVAFAMPMELKANWIFRISPVPAAFDWIRGARRALLLLAVAPVCILAGSACFYLWPWRAALGHLCVLICVGSALADITLHNFQKIPFTCSYLPGKSNVYFAFWAYVLLAIPLLDRAMRLERRLLQGVGTTVSMLVVLGIVAALSRWRTNHHSQCGEGGLLFEESPPPAIHVLNLHKDGVL